MKQVSQAIKARNRAALIEAFQVISGGLTFLALVWLVLSFFG